MIIISLIASGLIWAMFLFSIASGLTLILGTLRVLNFAQASLFLLGAYFTTEIVEALPLPKGTGVWLAIVGSVVILAIIGLAFEQLVRWVREREIEYQLLLTYALALITYDFILMRFGAIARFVPTPQAFQGSTMIYGNFVPRLTFLLLAFGIGVAIFLWYFLNKTDIGIVVKATSFREDTAKVLGVDTRKVFRIVFVMGVVIAAMGGAFAAMWIPASPGVWAHYVTLAFVIVVIGGLGSLKGAFIASFIVGLFTSTFTIFLPKWSQVFIFMIMILVLLVRPTGLFGRKVV